jgi:hypothetical protein
MPKTLTLPARDEGPHSWLGRLVRDDATRRYEAGKEHVTRLPELIQGEWQWLSRAWCWVLPDRSGLTFDTPNDYLETIVARHSHRHLDVSDELDATLPADHPARVEKAKRTVDERLEALRTAIWAHLLHGFCRVADDSDDILWWHLIDERFVPFDAAYNLAYMEWQSMYRGIAAGVQNPDNRPYLGPTQSKYRLDD